MITRALGSDANTLPDIYEMNLSDGDRVLLCSDGLSGMVQDNLIESTMARIKDPQNCANALVEEALGAGGHDNITAVVIDVASMAEKKTAVQRIKGRIGALALVLALIAVIVGGAAGARTYLDTVAFVTTQHDEVVIYRGLPGEFLGISLSQPDHATGLLIADLNLPANTTQRLAEEGIRTDSVQGADDLVKTWQDQAKSQAASNGPMAGTDKTPSTSNAENASAPQASAPDGQAAEGESVSPTESGDAA